ncbi:MAG: hypothetical protein KQI81_18015 [Deltaproteobacteria bacterium]|nr:hypothetical protein [Deltaproteobacteria bacterium]
MKDHVALRKMGRGNEQRIGNQEKYKDDGRAFKMGRTAFEDDKIYGSLLPIKKRGKRIPSVFLIVLTPRKG